MTQQELNSMDVHTVRALFDGTVYSLEILRVPSGWIYQYYRREITVEENESGHFKRKNEKVLFSTVFVPQRIPR